MQPTTEAKEALVGRRSPCRLVQLTEFADARGRLAVVQTGQDIDFVIKRVYYLYEMPPDTLRGAHAHRQLEQLIIAVGGGFDVCVDDGANKATFRLEDPSVGLYIGPMVWRDLINFSGDAVCLVLASLPYDEGDYYRDYDEFLLGAESAA